MDTNSYKRTKLRVFVHVGSDYATLTTTGTGGVQVDIIPDNYTEWYDIPLGITGNTINSIKFTRRGSGAFFDIYAVEVNGAVYVDNGVTAPNVQQSLQLLLLLEQNKVFRLFNTVAIATMVLLFLMD